MVHALPDGVLQEPATNLRLSIKNDAIPESTPEETADLQPHTQDDAGKDLKTTAEPPIEALCNDDFGRVDIYWVLTSSSKLFLSADF